jgi:hypothetical protein
MLKTVQSIARTVLWGRTMTNHNNPPKRGKVFEEHDVVHLLSAAIEREGVFLETVIERRLITGGFFLARRRFWHDEARNPDFTHPRALAKHPPPALHASRRQYWYEIANTRVLQTAHSADMIGTPVRE